MRGLIKQMIKRASTSLYEARGNDTSEGLMGSSWTNRIHMHHTDRTHASDPLKDQDAHIVYISMMQQSTFRHCIYNSRIIIHVLADEFIDECPLRMGRGRTTHQERLTI